MGSKESGRRARRTGGDGRWAVRLGVAVAGLAAVVGTSPRAAANEGAPAPGGAVDPAWYAKVVAQIRRDEYHVSWAEGLAAFASPNRANNLRFLYFADGFTVRPRQTRIPLFDEKDPRYDPAVGVQYSEVPDWNLDLRVRGVGRGRDLAAFGASKVETRENRAWSEDERLRVDYVNDDAGMRQDFVVKSRPEGRGRLRVELSVDTALRVRVGADVTAFVHEDGREAMRYSGLKAWDAEGTPLRAWMEKVESGLALVVNDERAVYPVTIDPLTQVANWNPTGTGGEAFGTSVASAGDVNLDGFSDALVGCPGFDNGGSTDAGRVLLFLGGAAGLSANSSWNTVGTAAGQRRGFSVSTAGDVNGDDLSDIIVGAPGFAGNQQTSVQGHAFVWLGAATTAQNTTGISGGQGAAPIWTGSGVANQGGDVIANWLYGFSVACAGDLDNDGFSDVIVGEPGYDENQLVDVGRAYAYCGHSTGPSVASDWTRDPSGINGGQTNTMFGFSVAGAGNVNGDGFSDVVIGAPLENAGGISDVGVVRVYHGDNSGSPLSGQPDEEIFDADGFRGGHAVSTAGDMDGDGYADIVFGAPGVGPPNPFQAGSIFVRYGGSSGINGAGGWGISQAGGFEGGAADLAEFGSSVCCLGDVEGDGFADIAVGAPRFNGNVNNEGAAFFFRGSTSRAQAQPAQTFHPSDTGDAGFGVDVAGGDWNGDGYSDMLVGQTGVNGDPNGRAWAFHGSTRGLDNNVAAFTTSGAADAQGGSRFGHAVACLGDANGDGFSDFAVGAPNFDDGANADEGRVYVYYGDAAGPTDANRDEFQPANQAGALYGWAVAGAGDVNADGFCDMIVAAPFFTGSHSAEGKVFLHHGASGGLTGVQWSSEPADKIGALYGVSVAGVGDMDHDGYADVAVGAAQADGSALTEGAVWLWLGKSSGGGIETTPVVFEPTNQTGSFFGRTVCGADVQGDGYADLIVGAPSMNDEASDEGAVFVFHGVYIGLPSTTPSAIWDPTDQAGAAFGTGLASAGDVNGDGRTDVIVGAPDFDATTNGNEGRVYFASGSASGLDTANAVTRTASIVGGRYGRVVAGLGEVNGDEFSDIGVLGSDSGLTGIVVDVFHGSAAGAGLGASPVTTLTDGSGVFGTIAAAGDVDGDGFSDVLIGAPDATSGTGSIRLFMGNVTSGLDFRARQYRKSGTTYSVLVFPNLWTNHHINAALGLVVHSPFGKGQVRVTYYGQAATTSFSAPSGTTSVSAWTTPAIGAVTHIKETLTIGYYSSMKCRMRIRYEPADGPTQTSSRFYYNASNAPNEADFWTLPY
jgi:hypothetical protein